MSNISNWIKTALVFLVIAVIMGVFNFDNLKHGGNIFKPKKASLLEDKSWDDEWYLSQSSPITTSDNYEIHDKALPTVTEAERFAHPKNTEMQLRRAKWQHMVAHKPVNDPTKPQKHISAAELKKYEDVPWVSTNQMDVEKQSTQIVKVLVGDTDTPIPALSSGELPVFNATETNAYKPEMIKLGLDELDFRRAAWWFKNHKRESVPQMPEDVAIRNQEIADSNISDEDALDATVYTRRYNARHGGVPLTANERLSKASDVLLKLNLAN